MNRAPRHYRVIYRKGLHEGVYFCMALNMRRAVRLFTLYLGYTPDSFICTEIAG